MDKIYTQQEMKLALKLKKLREKYANGEKIRELTAAEENMIKVEERVTNEYHNNQVFVNQQNVADVHNKAATFSTSAANKEKLNGHFNLKMSKNLTMPKKIEQYAQEPVVFFLHKNRNFIKKI